MKKATFGAGCFWGVEATFRRVPGVIDTAVGYAGGHDREPDLQGVCTDRTGHAEVVEVDYDPAKVSYDQLLDVFWSSHDPTQAQPPGARFRHPVPLGHLLPRRRAEGRGRGLEAEASTPAAASPRPIATQIVPAASVLSGRGIPPAISREARPGELPHLRRRSGSDRDRRHRLDRERSRPRQLLDQPIGVVDRAQGLEDPARVRPRPRGPAGRRSRSRGPATGCCRRRSGRRPRSRG